MRLVVSVCQGVDQNPDSSLTVGRRAEYKNAAKSVLHCPESAMNWKYDMGPPTFHLGAVHIIDVLCGDGDADDAGRPFGPPIRKKPQLKWLRYRLPLVAR